MIVGLQTDEPLKRIVNLYGGIRMAESALKQYGYEMNPEIQRRFHEFRKTHNEGVFDAYPKRTKVARHAGLLTGLPDAYGRGRIIGDYRRIALYGIDYLIEQKEQDIEMADGPMTEELIRIREELHEQVRDVYKRQDRFDPFSPTRYCKPVGSSDMNSVNPLSFITFSTCSSG